MRVTHQADDELTLHDSGVALIWFGAIFATFGLVAGLFAARENKTMVAVIAACLFSGAGTIMILRARAATHVLNARRGTLTVHTRPLLEIGGRTSETTEYRLDDLAAVELESNRTGSRGSRSTVYRLAYVFRDGRRVPWTELWTSGRSKHEATRAAVMSMLERYRRR